MTDSTTTNYGWAYPTVNADADTWGTTWNTAIVAIDAQVKTNAEAAAQIANNLSDLADAPTARTNLGLGTAATHDTSAFVAAGAALLVANNLSDILNQATCRYQLGLTNGATTTFTFGSSTSPSGGNAGDIYVTV